jgi:hypothetical protein
MFIKLLYTPKTLAEAPETKFGLQPAVGSDQLKTLRELEEVVLLGHENHQASVTIANPDAETTRYWDDVIQLQSEYFVLDPSVHLFVD